MSDIPGSEGQASPSNGPGRQFIPAIQGIRERKYLDAVKNLAALNIEQDLPLPRLVVVGNQSSGKSSILEAITQLNFPISSSLCTRFATQVDMRSNVHGGRSIRVWISHESTESTAINQQTSLLDVEGEFSPQVFTSVFGKALSQMGLPVSGEAAPGSGGKRFSTDILRVDLTGPEYPNLSLVDIPGLFESETDAQTIEDSQLVLGIAKHFIAPRQAIILAVASALEQPSTQPIFNLSKEHDPDGHRTLGILTKLDRVESGDEERVLNIIRNGEIKLRLGWFVVRNRTILEIDSGASLSTRNVRESALFQQSPWNRIDKARCGVTSLITALSGHLYDRINEELPLMCATIGDRISELKKRRTELGHARDSPIDQRTYLLDIAKDFETQLRDTLAARIAHDDPSRESLLIRSNLSSLREDFAKNMLTDGHKYVFLDAEGRVDSDFDRGVPTITTSSPDTGLVRATNAWISDNHQSRKGSDLAGTVHCETVKILFEQQTEPWEEISRKFIDSSIDAVRKFANLMYMRVVKNVVVRERLIDRLNDAQRATESRALKAVQDILHSERVEGLKTNREQYLELLLQYRTYRTIHALKRDGILVDEGIGPRPALSIEELLRQSQINFHDETMGAIHDVLKAYYVASRTFFIDAIKNTADILIGENSALHCFSPSKVAAMTDAELETLASESSEARTERASVDLKLGKFERASRIVGELQRDLTKLHTLQDFDSSMRQLAV